VGLENPDYSFFNKGRKEGGITFSFIFPKEFGIKIGWNLIPRNLTN